MSDNSERLNLFVPEWQGYAVDQSPGDGAQYLFEHLFQKSGFEQVGIPAIENLTQVNGVIGLNSVAQVHANIRSLLMREQPESIFTLGGTCGIEVTPVTYLNMRYQGDLALVWFDAHGDLNTPESSPSKHFHGMPVRTMMGEGDAGLIDLTFSQLSPDQLFPVGVRDLDPAEQDFLQRNQVSISDPDVNSAALIDRIKKAGFENVYLHFDLDVLDPADFDEMIFQIPNGMTCVNAVRLLNAIREQLNIVGSSLLEFVPRPDSRNFNFLRELIEGLK